LAAACATSCSLSAAKPTQNGADGSAATLARMSGLGCSAIVGAG
jgi:hypothetical protein